MIRLVIGTFVIWMGVSFLFISVALIDALLYEFKHRHANRERRDLEARFKKVMKEHNVQK